MVRIDALSLIAGILFTAVGAILLIVSIFVWPLVIYGIVIFVIGMVILFTLKEQERIEPIRKRKKYKR